MQTNLVVRLVAGGLVLLFLFSSLYIGAFHAPRAKGLDVGVVGTPEQATTAQSALDSRDRGAFDVRRYANEAQARTALLNTDVHGVLAGDRILVAQAFGAGPTDTIQAALTRIAPSASVTDLKPLPSSDARGLSSLFTVIGTLLPSVVFGVLLSVFGRALPAKTRWAAVVAYAVLAGLVVAFDADVLTGALEGHFAGLALVAGLFALAIGAAAHGLGHLGGAAGVVTVVVLLILLGLSSAGGAVTYELEPGFYGAISQLLPPGAALTAVRNVQYFDWAATLAPLLVLAAWAFGGLGLGLLGERYGPYARRSQPV
jgi:hypothetical protein